SVLSYFLFVSLMTSKTWLHRCVLALIVGASVVSVVGIVQSLTGILISPSAWVDSTLFPTLTTRAVGTLENPNMLGEYLVMLLPLTAASALHAEHWWRRLFSWTALALMIFCLGLTFSRGAWIAAMLIAILMVCLETRRVYPALILAALSVPLWLWVFPKEYLDRLVSVFNLSDSSLAYRLNIWKGTLAMIRDFFPGGIGTGESAWQAVYPSYALEAIESAPHAHNLFLQILVEIGVFGLLAFLIVLFVHLRSSLHAEKKLRSASERKAKGSPERKDLAYMRSVIRASFLGVIGSCLFGLTDYSWYNYRVTLVFFLLLALCSAHARVATSDLGEDERRQAPVLKNDEADLILGSEDPSGERGDSV
ncbi:MAG: O-antigen ligase family protein, partial [Clostridia bacterium]|nr:O-antigen ligase family protein [Clostridia bacterium]